MVFCLLKKIFFFLFIFLSSFLIESKEKENFISNIKNNFIELPQQMIRPENIPDFALMSLSTMFLWYADEEILSFSRRVSRGINKDFEDRKKVMFSIAGLPVRRPDNFNTSLYYLGDGVTQSLFTLGLYGTSFIQGNDKLKSVANQIVEGLVSMTMMNQFLKRVTGRETYNQRSKKRGRFHFFPAFKEYQSNVPKYDAYPSGHVATLLTTFTIIEENYPEEKYWMRPLNYSLIGALSFSMMSNGVHWASDYPLAIMMAVYLGKIISQRNNDQLYAEGKKKKSYYFAPFLNKKLEMGHALYYNF